MYPTATWIEQSNCLNFAMLQVHLFRSTVMSDIISRITYAAFFNWMTGKRKVEKDKGKDCNCRLVMLYDPAYRCCGNFIARTPV